MFRIGLIGAESSHAKAFARLIAAYPTRAKVTAVLEDGDGLGTALAAEFAIENIPHQLEGLYEHIDAAMVFYRDGARHFEVAQALLTAGISLWLDKPFTPQIAEAKALYRLAKEKSLTLDGGSTLRFCEDAKAFKEAFLNKKNEVLSACFNYMCYANSPYGGLFFYGPHAMTLLAEIFGPDAHSLYALQEGKSLIALAQYEGFAASVHMVDCGQSLGQLYLPQKVYQKEFMFNEVYRRALVHFLDLLTEKSLAPKKSLLAPVAYLSALDRSLALGQRVTIENWEVE